MVTKLIKMTIKRNIFMVTSIIAVKKGIGLKIVAVGENSDNYLGLSLLMENLKKRKESWVC